MSDGIPTGIPEGRYVIRAYRSNWNCQLMGGGVKTKDEKEVVRLIEKLAVDFMGVV
jgi:hypothetical protein